MFDLSAESLRGDLRHKNLTIFQRRLLEDAIRFMEETDSLRELVLDAMTDCNGYDRLMALVGPDRATEAHACVVGMSWRVVNALDAQEAPDA